MYIIPDKKFCFLASPRTGSKSVAKALTEQRNAVLVGSHHTTPEDHPEIGVDDTWVICAAVRNHWDALASWWFKIEGGPGKMTPMIKFLPRFCRNNKRYAGDGQLWSVATQYANQLIRYEWLGADLDTALVAAGMCPVELPHIRDSKRSVKAYQVFYKRDTASWVGKNFATEIKNYGYKF